MNQRLPLKFRLSFSIAWLNCSMDSQPGCTPDDAEAALDRFVVAMKRQIANHRRAIAGESTRPERVAAANDLLTRIGNCDRGFFRNGDRRAQFRLGEAGELLYVDEYAGRAIKIEHKTTRPSQFCHGGSLWWFVIGLRDYIQYSRPVGPEFGQHWGYSAEDLAELRRAARELGIAEWEVTGA